MVVLLWRGDALPTRATIVDRRLPAAPTPRHVAAWTVVLAGGASVLLLTGDASLRQGLIVTMVAALLALSFVVATGYSGQISVAQLAFAGVAGFTAVRLTDDGWPFLVAAVVGIAVAVVLGIVVAYPATRVRGMGLAVATLAFAVAIEELVLASPSVSGGPGGTTVPRPDLFGLDIGISARGSDNFRPAYGAVVLVVLVLATLAVANLRRNHTGLRWLAVRANERAAAAAGIDVTRTKLGAFGVAAGLAGVAGVLMAFSATTLSTSSFMVIGALVALAMTYLAGVSSIGGALLAGCLAQAGLLSAASGSGSGDTVTERYRFAISGVALIVMAIVAPEGITGLARRALRRRTRAAGTEPVAAAPPDDPTVGRRLPTPAEASR
jgi:ABC-type branched-subunit amino acid transport system permease subunit